MQRSPMVASPASLACAQPDEMNVRHAFALEDWKAHALACYPEEACGFIVADGSFIACENIHPEPLRFFEISPQAYLAAGEVVAVLHSHCTVGTEPALPWPSAMDMEGQIASGVAWGISLCDGETVALPFWWGDGVPVKPLVGRVFQHGIADCYALVRDWHRLEHGILIPEYPRDDAWWIPDENGNYKALYEDLFHTAGFERVYRDNPLPGDCFICHVRSPKTRNHAGVYVGGGVILHHLVHQLSQHSAAQIWRSKMDFLVRHKDMPETKDF